LIPFVSRWAPPGSCGVYLPSLWCLSHSFLVPKSAARVVVYVLRDEEQNYTFELS
jgi:hypothetical protein